MVPGAGFVLFGVLGSWFWVLGSGFCMQNWCGDTFAASTMLDRPPMAARTYREIVCWQLSNDLKRRVYALIRKPEVAKDFDFCDQIRRSARGAPRAISEGFGRFRPADFARYLEYARASLMETQNYLDDALDNEYVTAEEHRQLFALAERAIGASTKLHAYLGTCQNEPHPPRERRTPSGTSDSTKRPEQNESNTDLEPRTQNGTQHAEPGTQNSEPRTRNRTNPAPGTRNR
jgi:four helix bundle protein